MVEVARRLTKEEAGQGLVEYAMIISLIALLVIAAFPAFRTALEGLYNDITAGFTQ